MKKFRTPYDDDYKSSDFAFVPVGESMTHQSFKDECDINTILDNMQRVGFINAPPDPPVFDDVSSGLSYHEALNFVMAADDAFNSLDARVRARFENNPANLLHFLDDPSNKEEAIRLGLLKTEPVPKLALDVMGTTDTNNQTGE